MDDPPPPYDLRNDTEASNQPTSQSTSPQYQAQVLPPSKPPEPLQQSSTRPLFALLQTHRPIGLYHANNAGSLDLVLGLSADSPPLCHVTINAFRTPSIALHASSRPQSPLLAKAQYHFPSKMDIEAAPLIAGDARVREQLLLTNWWPKAWSFAMLVPRTGAGIRTREEFEWKYSGGEEVRALEGQTKGLKCVRVATGEVVCAWAWTLASSRKKGKFQWVLEHPGGGGMWGEDAELMVVMTLLAVLEMIRRDRGR